MESDLAKQVKVGVFALIGLIVLMVSILLLGGDQYFLRSTYQLKVRLNNVQGLARGSIVSLSGVPVGNVGGIRFNGDNIDVILDIDSDFQKRITTGSKASVKTQGALGDKYVFIEPGPLDAPPLKAGDLLLTDTTPGILDILTQKGAEFGKILTVIDDVHKLFESINADNRTGKLLKNLDDGSNDFKLLMAQLRTKTLPKLNSIIDKVDQGKGTLGELINDPSIHNRLSQILGASPRNEFLTPLIRGSIHQSEQK